MCNHESKKGRGMLQNTLLSKNYTVWRWKMAEVYKDIAKYLKIFICHTTCGCVDSSHTYYFQIMQHTNICFFASIVHNPLFFWSYFIILLILRPWAFLWYYDKSPNQQNSSKPTYYFFMEQSSWGSNTPINTELLLWLIPHLQLCHQTIYSSHLHILFPVFIPIISRHIHISITIKWN